ncbi:MAG: hypothetical protein GC164_03360 [Phycisphaera sp.]|nr:hypothetical protein [Phycisphaera sp.]
MTKRIVFSIFNGFIGQEAGKGMGWFLSGQKGGRAGRGKPRKKSSRTVSPKWDPKRTLAGLKGLAIACAVVGFFVGWHYAELALRAYAGQRAEAVNRPLNLDRVAMVNPPTWLDDKDINHLRMLVAGRVTADPLDRDSLSRAAVALAQSPWINGVESIERCADQSVRVQADFRKPVAAVQSHSGYILVDKASIWVAGPWPIERVDSLNLPVIVGVASAPLRAGVVWPGDDLKAGLDLATLLTPQPYAKEIRAIDVSARDARGRIKLMLATRTGQVLWGLPPGKEHPIEPDALDKLHALASFYSQNQRSIELPGRTVDLSLSSDVVFINRAVANP